MKFHEQEKTDMWVDLTDNGEVAIEEQMQALERNVHSQRAIFMSALVFPWTDFTTWFLGPVSSNSSSIAKTIDDILTHNSTTGGRMPGTAAEAIQAVKMTQSGAVR